MEVVQPQFQQWLQHQIYSKLDWDQNHILVAKQADRVVGVALLKHCPLEPKIRCVRVAEDYVGTGLGIRLIESSIETLEVRRPHVTVAEELLHQYSRAFIKRFGFKLDDVSKGLYRKGKLEYIFNKEH